MQASMRRAPLALVPLLALTGACSFNSWIGGYHFDYTGVQSERNAGEAIPDGVVDVEIDHSFGDVKVQKVAEGEAPSWDWKVICWADDEALAKTFAEQVALTVERTDEHMSWTLEMPEPPARGLRGLKSTLTLRVAAPTAVALGNRHGDTFVRGIDGDVRLDTAHGDLALDQLGGTLEVDHAHGDVAARGFESGKLSSSHGQIAAADVRGSVQVRGAHGHVELDRIVGEVKIARDHGSVRMNEIAGPVHARGNHVDWTIDGAGGLDLSSDHTDILAQGVSGTVRMSGSHFDASLEGLAEDVDVSSTHGNVHLTLVSPSLTRVSAEVDHGDVDVTVSAALDALVRAKASHGDIDSDLPVMLGSKKQDESEDVRLVLRTSHGDVRVRRGH